MRSEDSNRPASGQPASDAESDPPDDGHRPHVSERSYSFFYHFPYKQIADQLLERADMLRPSEGVFVADLRHQRHPLSRRQANWLHGICKRLGVDDHAIR